MTELYRERGCARGGPLMLWGIVAPVALLIVAVVGVVEKLVPVYLVGGAGFLLCLIVPTKLLLRSWPSGIVVDTDGITVGAVGPKARRVVAPTTQARGRFRVSWADVSRVDVVATRTELAGIWKLANATAGVKPARLRRGPYSAGQGFSFVEGLLPVWGMRAALVITLRDPDVGERPAYRAVRGQGHVRRAVWASPTRRPDELRAALALVSR